MDQKVLAIVPSVSKPAVGDVNEDMDWQQIQSSHSSDRLLTNELRHRRGFEFKGDLYGTDQVS
ncbi:hypothetical protein CCACVL1_03367 [Corchorus capsularis]|uniref:Uncharacterized protein n=1 Tax=Corchorus capsularis TaxID=210143 RepID=A0A1R3JZV7_COCAP|nr:hypothetical protein CCACVL1_03367 [Corchorus capsularis]